MVRKILILAPILLFVACAHNISRPPKLIKKGNVNYPISAQLAQIEGEVLLGLYVNELGIIEEAEIISSSGNADIDSASLEYTRSLEFSPAIIDGKKHSAWTKLLLKFNLTTVYFDPEEWIKEIHAKQWFVTRKKEPDEIEKALRELFIAYHGFLKFAEKEERSEKINDVLTSVVTTEVLKNYNLLLKHYPAAFILLEDFLFKYPGTKLIIEVKYKLNSELRKFIDSIEKGFFKYNVPEDAKKNILELLKKRLNKLDQELNILG